MHNIPRGAVRGKKRVWCEEIKCKDEEKKNHEAMKQMPSDGIIREASQSKEGVTGPAD